MPDTITHILFAEKALGNLKETIDEQAYYLGSLGPDPLFYYNLPSLKDKRNARELGSKVHAFSGKIFLDKGQLYTDGTKGDKSTILRSYLHGFLTHFILDSSSHPYINSVSRIYPNGHKQFEMNIDTLLLYRFKKKSSKKFSFDHYLKIDREKLVWISEMFTFILKNAYSEEMDEMIFLTAVDQMRKVCNLFRDPLSIFLFFTKAFEILVNKKGWYRYFLYNQPGKDAPDYLNLSKKLYPDSFTKIFYLALEKHRQYIKGININETSKFDFSGRISS